MTDSELTPRQKKQRIHRLEKKIFAEGDEISKIKGFGFIHTLIRRVQGIEGVKLNGHTVISTAEEMYEIDVDMKENDYRIRVKDKISSQRIQDLGGGQTTCIIHERHCKGYSNACREVEALRDVLNTREGKYLA